MGFWNSSTSQTTLIIGNHIKNFTYLLSIYCYVENLKFKNQHKSNKN